MLNSTPVSSTLTTATKQHKEVRKVVSRKRANTTTLYLANGLARTVKGRAEDVGVTVRTPTETGFRQFQTIDGQWITVNQSGILLVEEAPVHRSVGFVTESEVK